MGLSGGLAGVDQSVGRIGGKGGENGRDQKFTREDKT